MPPVAGRAGRDPALRIALLAAGRSRRLGTPKQLVQYRGAPLIRHAAEQACPLVETLWVVLGSGGDAAWQALAGLDALRRLDAPATRDGLSASVRVAAEAARADAGCQRLLLMLVDQYRVDTAWLTALSTLGSGHPGQWVASAYEGVRGVPALFPRSAFEALIGLQGDRGARDLLRAAAPDALIEYASRVPPGDLDTPEDLRHLT